MQLFAQRPGRRLLAVLALGAVALGSVVACRDEVPAPGVVAASDLGGIGRTDLDEHILALPEARRSPPAGEPLAEWRRRLLEEMIVARALQAEARSNGLAETPEGRQMLAGRSELILAQTLGERLISDKVEVTDEDLRAFYDAHPEDFSNPRQIRVRNIYRRVARDAPPEVWETVRQEVEGLLDEIRRGARFGDLARTHSDSETASLDGLIGRLDRGKLEPALEDILWSLGEGEVSAVIRTPVGFHLFKVENHLEQGKVDFEDARTRLLRRLTREATEAAEEAVLRELLAASGATYEPDALEGEGPEAVLFALGDDSLTVAGFHQRLDGLGFFAARDLLLRRQLDQAVRERLYLWQAERQGLAAEPELAARLEQEERQVLIALARAERRRAVAAELEEQELLEFYAARAERLRTPRLLRLRILTRDFPAEEDRWYAVYEELERLAEEIRAGRRDFAAAARELSADYTAVRGGDVGAIRADAFAEWAGPQAQRKVLALSPGEVSEPLLIERYNSNRLTYERAGYMLVRLEAIEESRRRPFEEVRDKVIEQYLEQGGEEIQGRIRQEVLSSVGAEIYPENL